MALAVWLVAWVISKTAPGIRIKATVITANKAPLDKTMWLFKKILHTNPKITRVPREDEQAKGAAQAPVHGVALPACRPSPAGLPRSSEQKEEQVQGDQHDIGRPLGASRVMVLVTAFLRRFSQPALAPKFYGNSIRTDRPPSQGTGPVGRSKPASFRIGLCVRFSKYGSGLADGRDFGRRDGRASVAP